MNRFATGRDAKEYLIQRILAQADRDGVSLSDVERKMLYFSETGWTLPDMMAVNQAFDEKYDEDEFENKIGQIVRRISFIDSHVSNPTISKLICDGTFLALVFVVVYFVNRLRRKSA